MQAWIYIDIFDTKYFYKLLEQHEGFTNQIFKRLFTILTEDKFRIHQHKCIQNWDSKRNKLLLSDDDDEDDDNDEDEDKANDEDEDNDEEENENETDCSNIDGKLYLSYSYSK